MQWAKWAHIDQRLFSDCKTHLWTNFCNCFVWSHISMGVPLTLCSETDSGSTAFSLDSTQSMMCTIGQIHNGRILLDKSVLYHHILSVIILYIYIYIYMCVCVGVCVCLCVCVSVYIPENMAGFVSIITSQSIMNRFVCLFEHYIITLLLLWIWR